MLPGALQAGGQGCQVQGGVGRGWQQVQHLGGCVVSLDQPQEGGTSENLEVEEEGRAAKFTLSVASEAGRSQDPCYVKVHQCRRAPHQGKQSPVHPHMQPGQHGETRQ